MTLRETVEKIAMHGGEEFIPTKDAKNADSIRVSAFNAKRRLPAFLISNVGIQKFTENGRLFIRIYGKTEDEPNWIRNEEGKLVPMKNELTPEKLRQIELMRKDGLSEEEIQEALAD